MCNSTRFSKNNTCSLHSTPVAITLSAQTILNLQIEAMRRGLLKVLSQAVLDLLTWQELERRVCGDPDLTVESLKKCSKYDNINVD